MVLDTAKNLTQWLPSKGNGVILLGNCFIVDQNNNFIVDQSKNFLVTTPTVVSAPNLTSWTATPAS